MKLGTTDLRRILWRGLLTITWIVVIALLAEFWARAWPLAIETFNPYMQARWHGANWPRSDSESALISQVPAADTTLLKKPTHEEQMVTHAIYLLSQDKTCREAYARIYKMSLYFGQGKSLDDLQAYGEMATESADGLKKLLADLESAAPFAVEGNSWNGWACRAFSKDPDGEGPLELATAVLLQHKAAPESDVAVFFFQNPYNAPPAESAYRYAFIDFKAHASLPDGGQFFGLPEFRLNNYGFRDDDVVVPRPPNVFRVACVGASTTMEGATNGFTYPNLVEYFLRERFKGKAIEVINCGVSGTDAEVERARFADYLAVDANIIIYYNAINSIIYNDLRDMLRQQDECERMLMWSRFSATCLPFILEPNTEEWRLAFLQGSVGDVLSMADSATTFGVTPILCTFSHPDGPNLSYEERVYYGHDARMHWVGRGFTLDTYLRAITLWNDMLREECAARDIAMIDVAAQLTGGGQVFGDLCHMKDYGIEQKARVVAAGLEPYVEAFYAGGTPPAP